MPKSTKTSRKSTAVKLSTLKSRATIVDIARVAGVSKSTVSLVLQESSLVKKETRETVQNVIEQLGYVTIARLRACARLNLILQVLSSEI